jgi:O-antigen/teichoic acid export membrane protein
LWAATLVALANFVAMLATVGRRYGRFLKSIMLSSPKGPRLDWRKDILPMQWRVSLSWLSGYFTFSLFTPVLFHYHGPVVAGQMGMTWAFVAALTSVASSWITPKAPTFGILIAQKEYARLDEMFWHLTKVVIAVTALGAVCIWGMVYGLNQLNHPYAFRVLSPLATSYLLLATVVLASGLPMSTYLRAHKKEPLLGLSLVGGMATGIAVIVLGKYSSVEYVALGYLLVMIATLPFLAWIWRVKRAEWHSLHQQGKSHSMA